MRGAVCRAPPAAPEVPAGTDSRVSVVFGDATIPPPSPASRSGPAVVQPTPEPPPPARMTAVAVTPAPAASSPATVSIRPSLGTRRPARIADAALPSANGVTASPDRSGEDPRPSWKHTGSTPQIP